MADSHGRSVNEANKVNACLVLNIRVFIYFHGILLLHEPQRKLSVLKQRYLFLFFTQLFY